MKIKIELTCTFHNDANDYVEVEIPDGWNVRHSGIDMEEAFCPEHAKAEDWLSQVCPGCVGGWGDCPLYRGFAYERKYTQDNPVSRDDLAVIETGVCPKRVNGTFMRFEDDDHLTSIDISDRATTEAGKAMADGIRTYWEHYPVCAPEALGDPS